MILPIYIYGHPILRKSCVSISFDYKNLDNLIDNMFKTMKNANGIGLSAPQIGLSIKLFIIDITEYAKEDPSVPSIRGVFINPEIIQESGDVFVHNEGCLSIPGIRGDVERKSIIRVSYLDKDFNKKYIEIDGLFARVFQHEYDHLNETLFVDHLKPEKKNIINRKLNQILKGRFEETYPTILKK